MFFRIFQYLGGDYTTVDRIVSLMSKNHITAKYLTSHLELSNSSITDWKKGKAKPSTDAIVKIANFFDVSTDFLLTGKSTTSTSVSSDDSEWLSLIHRLPEHKRNEFKSRIEGYLECYEESVKTDESLKKTGTTNSAK